MALGLWNSLSGLLILIFVSSVAAQDSSVTVQVGRRAVLRCAVSQITFNYAITWERADGTFLGRGNNYTINSVSLNDRGTYVCRIRNVADSTQVATSRIDLNVVPENAPPPRGSASIRSIPKANERLVIGGLIFRSCKVNDPTGGAWSYSWVYPDGRTTRTSMLYITGITPAQFGTYRCIATSSRGQRLETRFTVSPQDFKSTVIPVTFAPVTASAQGSLSVRIRRVRLANPMILECYVDGGRGGASYTYEWRKDNRFLARGQRLTVDKLLASTGGSYECVVNGFGAGGQVRGDYRYNMRVLVKQTETKIALTPPPGPTHVVEVGSNKELHCELDQTQDRQEVARWFRYKDNSPVREPLNPPSFNIYPTRSVSILVMTNLQKSDTGRYECIVMRNGREILREASVVVIQDVGLEVYPSTMTYTMRVTRNNPEFHCQVDNLPGGAKGVVWTFVPGLQSNAQEQPLPSNAKLTMRPGIASTSFLTIVNPTMANYGYYVCRAPGGYSGRAALVVRQSGTGRSSIRLMVRPGIVVTVDPGQTARVLCFEPSGQQNIVPNWRVPSNVQSQVTTEVQSQRQILLFRNVRADQDGTQFTCYYRDAKPITVTIKVNAGCPFGQRRCRSGTCIQDSFFCNGRRDCPDGSDEDRANCAKCEPNEQECQRHNNRDPVKKCVPIHWICDGENDCGNNWDESQNCQVGVGCDKTLFQCDDGRRIPRGFLCDGENDCRRNDDETGCSVPRIVRPSGSRPQVKRANRGSEVRLVCEAVGKGTPKIVWRYNWGFVTARHRIEERCVDPDTDISTLILSSVDVRDAGIYTCEALNNQGRAFGEDYVVEVNGR